MHHQVHSLQECQDNLRCHLEQDHKENHQDLSHLECLDSLKCHLAHKLEVVVPANNRALLCMAIKALNNAKRKPDLHVLQLKMHQELLTLDHHNQVPLLW